MKFRRQNDRQVPRLLTLHNATDIAAGSTIGIWPAGAVADQAARFGLLSVGEDRRQGMTRHLHDKLGALNKKKRIGTDDQRTDPLRNHSREGLVDLTPGAGVEDVERLPDRCCSSLHGLTFCEARWIVRIDEQSDDRSRGDKLTGKLQPFDDHRRSVEAHARDIALRAVQVVNDARSNGIAADRDHDRDRRGRPLAASAAGVPLIAAITATRRSTSWAASAGSCP